MKNIKFLTLALAMFCSTNAIHMDAQKTAPEPQSKEAKQQAEHERKEQQKQEQELRKQNERAQREAAKERKRQQKEAADINASYTISVSRSYDRFKNVTVLALNEMPVHTNLKGITSTNFWMTTALGYEGEQPATPSAIYFSFRTRSQGWDNPLFSYQTELIFIADGRRYNAGHVSVTHTNDEVPMILLGNVPITRTNAIATAPYELLENLARASNVEFQLGGVEGVLNYRHIQGFRELISNVSPSSFVPSPPSSEPTASSTSQSKQPASSPMSSEEMTSLVGMWAVRIKAESGKVSRSILNFKVEANALVGTFQLGNLKALPLTEVTLDNGKFIAVGIELSSNITPGGSVTYKGTVINDRMQGTVDFKGNDGQRISFSFEGERIP